MDTTQGTSNIRSSRISRAQRLRKTSFENEYEFIDDAARGSILGLDLKHRKPNRLLLTREVSRFFDRETFLKTSLKEMLIFIGFIITLIVITNSDTTSVQYFYQNALVGIFVDSKFNSMTGENINFREINSLDHIWPYLDDVLIDNLYWSYWYLTGQHQDTSDLLADESFIMYTNKLIGLPRIRQVRVRNDSCEIPDDFKLMFTACYAEYSSSTEDKTDFGPANSTAWTFNEPSILGTHRYTGEISTYGGGGYYVDIGLTKQESKNIISELKNNLWLDRASRVVIIDFTTYNANINYFCFVKLIFELPPTGGVLSYYEIETQRFNWHFNVWEIVQITFNVIFLLYFILFFAQEIYEIIYLKWHFIRSFWNWLDVTLIVLSGTVIGLYFYRHFTIRNKLATYIEAKDSHAVFDDLLSIQYSFTTSISILLFLSYIKFLKYLAFNHSMYQMQSTLSRASTDILCFSVIFFTVFIAFAQLGHLLFGSQVRDFRTFGQSIFALLRTVVGDFDYQAIESANHLLGPIFFFSYIFFIFFILVNMFLAIIIDTYSEVRSDLHTAGIKTHMGDLIGRYFNNFLRKIGLKKLADSREQKPEVELARATYQEMRNLLDRCGFSELEIDLFFEKYEITEDRLISPDEMRKILSKVEDLPAHEGDPRLSIAMQDYEATNVKISERISILEDEAIGANNKIDIILNKLDGILQLRMARRRTT